MQLAKRKLLPLIGFALIALTSLIACPLVRGQLVPELSPVNPAETASENSKAAREDLLSELETQLADAELDEETKKRLQDVITQARDQVSQREAKIKLAQERQASTKSAPQRAATAQDTLKKLENFKPKVRPSSSLVELEADLASLQASEKAIKQVVISEEEAMKNVASRRSEVESELLKLNRSLEERTEQFGAFRTETKGTIEDVIKIAEMASSVDLIQASIVALESEVALLDAEAAVNLPQLSRDSDARKLETIQEELVAVEALVKEKRADDAAQRVRAASEQVTQVKQIHAALLPIGEENLRLAKMNQTLAGKLEEKTNLLQSRTLELDRLRANFAQATERVEKVGLTNAVGAMLRNLKQGLPSISLLRFQIRERSTDENDSSYTLMDLTDQRNRPLRLTIDRLLLDARPPLRRQQREALEPQARELLQEQRLEFLDPVIASQTKYFNTLVSISTIEEEIIQLTEESSAYINENILWIRSTQPLYVQPTPGEEEWWFLKSQAWLPVGTKIRENIRRHLGVWLAISFSCVVLVLSRYRLRAEVSRLGEQARPASFARFGPTAETFGWTVAMSLPVPLICWFLGRQLHTIAGGEQALLALAFAAGTLAYLYFPLNFARQVCRNGGLAECHFGWSTRALSKVRNALRMLLFSAVPLASFAAFLSGGNVSHGNDTMERYVSLAAMTTLGVFLFRVGHPRRGAPAHFLATHPEGWLSRLSFFWYPILMAVPVSLATLTVLGYHFTSQQIGWRFFQSLGLVFGIGVLVSMVMRWSTIHRRRLRIEQVQSLRAKREAEQKGNEATASETIAIEMQESPEELREQMRQSRSLFRTAMTALALIGMWLVWSDVIPALGIFNRWPLWSSTEKVTEVVVNESGEAITQTREVVDPVTIAEIGFAALVLFLTVAAVRNLPGLLEFAVLRRLPLDQSVRYAITTMATYVIIFVGIVVAGSLIGLHWNQIQWMATALTFGLAFGLQEMFANFIAGIIILFEQPVRVGDVVEIDNVTGTVSKIRIRATTITDWNRRDYIVPNKEFITGKLHNWTRSDDISRVVIVLGVAYGSDTVRARDLLIEVASEHPEVLDSPAPSATFDHFGASSLDFTLRAYVSSFDKRHNTAHDLRMSIDQRFRDAKIEISFPQRDLHLRSVPESLQQALASMNQSK